MSSAATPAEAAISMHEIGKAIAPLLSYATHKGDHGRIGVIGGSKEYTGAPYFAAISAMKLGADLVHVFCHPDASVVIKSYSPDLIVHPLINLSCPLESASFVAGWFDRLHALVVGPGLGRENGTEEFLGEILAQAKSRNLPIVMDADSLFFVLSRLEFVKDYERAVLTPNAAEFVRFLNVLGIKGDGDETTTTALASAMNVTIVRKGETDIISNGKQTLQCREKGSPRRVGGQGDILSGLLGLLCSWAYKSAESPICSKLSPALVASYAACHLTKQCSLQTFNEHRRSMITSDMLTFLPKVVRYYFSE